MKKKSKLTFASKVSPAKMALRRHLSQERLTPQQSSEHSSSSSESKHNPHQHQSRLGMHAANSSGNGNGNGGILGTRTIGDLVSGEIERTLEISNQTIINAAVNMNMGGRPENSYSPINRPSSVEAESNLSTLAHVASYAPTPSVTPTSTPSPAISRSSVLYPPQQSQPQR